MIAVLLNILTHLRRRARPNRCGSRQIDLFESAGQRWDSSLIAFLSEASTSDSRSAVVDLTRLAILCFRSGSPSQHDWYVSLDDRDLSDVSSQNLILALRKTRAAASAHFTRILGTRWLSSATSQPEVNCDFR